MKRRIAIEILYLYGELFFQLAIAHHQLRLSIGEAIQHGTIQFGDAGVQNFQLGMMRHVKPAAGAVFRGNQQLLLAIGSADAKLRGQDFQRANLGGNCQWRKNSP